MDDITLKKKTDNRYNNAKKIYFGIMGLFLLIGISYALVFFMERFESNELGFTTDLLDVSISENGLVTIDNANNQKDTDGINNDKTTFTIVNNNRVPIRVIIKLVEDKNSNLSTENIRFGVLGGGEILNVDSLGNTNGVLYDFFMEPGQNANLQTTLWLDYYYQGGSISEVFSGKYVVEASNANQFAYSYLTDLVGKDKGLYAINEDGTLNSGTGTVKEYRYSGLTPDNYVYFNNEVWRIISVSNDGMLKIVRNEEIKMANYPSNDEYYDSLGKTYQEYVLNTTFNTGAVSLTDTYSSLLTNESSSATEGYVNYINASDYLYSAEPTYYTSALNSTNISSNTWLYGTYLTANGISGSENVLGINQNIPTSASSTDTTYSIKPCVYLKKTVSIVEGYGTLEKPYVLDYADVKELVPIITYDLNGGNSEVLFNKVTEGITSVVPRRIGYAFVGWSSNKDAQEAEYQSGDAYEGGAITLYAIWEERVNVMNTFPTAITDNKTNISEVHFININDEELEELNVEEIDLTYNNQGKVTGWLVEDETDTTKSILYIGSEGKTYLNTGNSLFYGFSNMATVETENIDTSMVKSMYFMFRGCSSLTTLGVSNWDVSSVTDMLYMFYDCSSLTTLGVSNWDVSNVTDMTYMFYGCSSLVSLDVSNWAFEGELLNSTFSGCSSLTVIDVSNWNVSNVTYFGNMFKNCSSLVSLDLSNWDVSNSKSFTNMFDGCIKLVTIYSDTNWQEVATNITNTSATGYMFRDCTSLIGKIAYTSTKRDISMANPDDGYFTRKEV